MLLLKNGLVHTMQGDPFVGDVAIENGKIAAAGPDIPSRGYRVIDASGCQVLPGLIDAHSHIGLWESGSRDTDHNEKITPITPEMRAIDAIHPQDVAFREARETGVTTCVTGPGSINLIGGSFCAVKTWGNTVEKMLLKQTVAMKAALGENPKFRYNEMGKSPRSRMASAALLRQALFDAQQYVENPPAKKDFRMEALAPVVKGELPLKIHAHRCDDIITAIRICDEFGVSYTLDHCTEGYMITDSLLEALGKNCRGIIAGPLIINKTKPETENSIGTQLPAALHRAGIPIALCSDFFEIHMHSFLPQLAMAVADGLNRRAALEAVTINAAKICGIADRVGSIAPGMDADIAVFTGDPLHYETHCKMTIINGEVVFERSAFL